MNESMLINLFLNNSFFPSIINSTDKTEAILLNLG